MAHHTEGTCLSTEPPRSRRTRCVQLLIGEFDVASLGFTSDSRRLTFIATIGRSQGTFGPHRGPTARPKAARSTSRSLVESTGRRRR
jgi:hypothetical protein